MKIKDRTYLLLVLGALFVAFGTLLNLWFYAIAGFVVPLYLASRFFAFQMLISTLRVDVQQSTKRCLCDEAGI